MKITIPIGNRVRRFGGRVKGVIEVCRRVVLNRSQEITPTPDTGCFRLTEDGNFRITEAGAFRIIEQCDEPPSDIVFGFDAGFDLPFG